MIDRMQKLVSLTKRRGFIFSGSEIYGGLAGTYDYGPLGSLLKNNIKNSWLDKFVHKREDMHLIDSAILMNRDVWQASGHIEGFHDPLVDDVKTNKRYRADHLLEEAGIEDAESLSVEEMTKKIHELGLKSPEGNDFGEVKQFNLMLATTIGPVDDSANKTYLRPETAQGMFVNYKNVMDSLHPKLPFGIAQIGKSFRNEITPRDFIFRQREFEIMELEYFIHPDNWKANFQYWIDEQLEWLEEVGLDMEKLHQYEHPEEARAHYSLRTMDWEFEYPFGRKELTGLAYRTDFDLVQHQKHSKQKLQYTDSATGETFVPHTIEPTFGLDRMVLAILVSAYKEEETDNGDTRVYMKFSPALAPYKVAVSPLLKNKPDLVEGAHKVFRDLKMEFGNVAWDDNGNIGKRYRRQDEIGTPFCVVFDFESLDDNMVTVRHRDTMKQERVAIEGLYDFFKKHLSSDS